MTSILWSAFVCFVASGLLMAYGIGVGKSALSPLGVLAIGLCILGWVFRAFA